MSITNDSAGYDQRDSHTHFPHLLVQHRHATGLLHQGHGRLLGLVLLLCLLLTHQTRFRQVHATTTACGARSFRGECCALLNTFKATVEHSV